MHEILKPTESAAASDGLPERVFADGEGVKWRAFERPFSDYDRRTGVSLIFASESAVRRVRDYPSNWRALTDKELETLSWKA